MPILLWHLPLVIFFGWWDVAVSLSEKRSVEAPFDARLAPETAVLAVEVGWLMADASAPKLGRVEPVCLAAAVPDRIHHVACAT